MKYLLFWIPHDLCCPSAVSAIFIFLSLKKEEALISFYAQGLPLNPRLYIGNGRQEESKFYLKNL